MIHEGDIGRDRSPTNLRRRGHRGQSFDAFYDLLLAADPDPDVPPRRLPAGRGDERAVGARRPARPGEQAREHLRDPRGHCGGRRAAAASPRAPGSRSRICRPPRRTTQALRAARGGDEPRGLPVPGHLHARSRTSTRTTCCRRSSTGSSRRSTPPASRRRTAGRTIVLASLIAARGRTARRLLQGLAGLPQPPRPRAVGERPAAVRRDRRLRHRQHSHRVDDRRASAPTPATRTTPTCTPACRSARSATPATSRSTRRCTPPTAPGCSS